MTHKFLRILGTALIVVVMLLWLGRLLLFDGVLPRIIDMAELKAKIETSIQQSTGIRAEIKEISIRPTVFEGIQIVFDNNILFDPEDIQVVQAGQVVVNVRYLPLLSRKTSISKIAFNNIEVYIGERSFLFRLKRPKVPSKEVFLEDARIEFNNYHIIVDRYFDGVNKYFLDGGNLALSHVKSSRPLELRGVGTGYFGVKDPNQRIGEFTLYGKANQVVIEKPHLDWRDLQILHLRLNDVQLATLSSIFRTYGVPVTASGEIKTFFLDLHGRDVPKTLTFQGSTAADTRVTLGDYDFRFKPGALFFTTDLRLNIQQRLASLENMYLQLSSDKFRFFAQGDIRMREPVKESLFDLKARSTELPISALELLPTLPPRQQRLLQSLSGDFTTNLRIKGPLRDPRITGSVKLSDVTIRSLKTGNLLASGLRGTFAILAPQYFAVQNVKGTVAQSPFSLDGRFNLKANTMDARLQTTGIYLGEFRQLLLQFAPNLKPFNRLVTTGQADVNLRARGTLTDPQLYGTLAMHNVNLRLPQQRVPMLGQLFGTLRFRDKAVHFMDVQGLIDSAAVQVTGSIQRATSNLNLRVRSRNVRLSEAQRLIREITAALGTVPNWVRRFDVDGRGTVNLRLTGPVRNLTLQGQVSVANAQVIDRVLQLKLSDITGLMAFTKRAITIPRLRGRFQGTPFTASGKLQGPGYQQLNLAINASDVNLSNLKGIVKGVNPRLAQQIDLSGKADLALRLIGTLQQPVLTGAILLEGAQVAYLPRRITLANLTGRMNLTPERIQLEGIQGALNGIPVALSGTVAKAFQDYRVSLQAKGVSVTRLQEVLVTIVPAIRPQLLAATLQSGTADVNLILSPSFAQGIGGTVTLRNLLALPRQLDMPVRVAHLVYDISTGRLQFPPGGAQVGTLRFTIQGFASARGYQLRLVSQEIPISFLRDERAFMARLIPFPLPTLYNTAGSVQLDAKIAPATKELVVRFLDAGASLKELKYPIYNMNGVVSLSLANGVSAYTNDLTFRYGNSPVTTSFDINGLQDIYIESLGTISPLLVNDFLSTGGYSTIAYAALPFSTNISGKLGSFIGEGLGNDLTTFLNFNIASLFQNPELERPSKPGDSSLNQATLSSVLHLVGDTLLIEKTRFRATEDGSIMLDGRVDNLFTPGERQFEVALLTEPVLDLAALAQQFDQTFGEGLSGKIGANLKLSSTDSTVNTTGSILLDNITSTALDVIDLDGAIHFNGSKAVLDIDHFEIPGVNVGFTATLVNLFAYPLPIVDFNLTGQQFIVSLYTEWINNVVVGKIRKQFWEQFFPNTGRPGSLPFEIQSGTLQIAEGIVNNLIMENFSSTIRVYPNTYFELDNAHAQSAGGNVSGYFAMNPRNDNFMTAHLVIDKMKANAVSRILLNVTNQIFGDLSGVIDYTTHGKTSEELLSNTNGFAELRIENGRLPSIAKIENLLIAANTISGGLANLNLNSLLRLAAPFQTEYFATLTGTFKMIEGIIYTDDMTSNGENLDLFFRGSIRMMDGFGDMLVRGVMDREIGGVLGPLGEISLGRFLGLFPPLRKLISYIPGIGFIPGFGGPRTEGIAFEVRIVGPLLDPGSVQDFRWVQ